MLEHGWLSEAALGSGRRVPRSTPGQEQGGPALQKCGAGLFFQGIRNIAETSHHVTQMNCDWKLPFANPERLCYCEKSVDSS
jgi:hypothetical protein